MPDLNSVHPCAGARARGGHRLEDQVQKSVIKCSSTSLCLAECLDEKTKGLGRFA